MKNIVDKLREMHDRDSTIGIPDANQRIGVIIHNKDELHIAHRLIKEHQDKASELSLTHNNISDIEGLEREFNRYVKDDSFVTINNKNHTWKENEYKSILVIDIDGDILLDVIEYNSFKNEKHLINLKDPEKGMYFKLYESVKDFYKELGNGKTYRDMLNTMYKNQLKTNIRQLKKLYQ